MKLWQIIILAAMLIGASAAVTHFLVDVGNTRCEAKQATAVVAAATHEIAQGTITAAKDSSNAGHLAVAINKTTSTTTDLRGAIDEPERKSTAPAAITRIPNPFPAGFSVCWNAASSRDPAAVAACKARRGDGIPIRGQPGEYGYGPAPLHDSQRPMPAPAGSSHGSPQAVPGGAPGGHGRPGQMHAR